MVTSYKIKKHQFAPWWCNYNLPTEDTYTPIRLENMGSWDGERMTFTINLEHSIEDVQYFMERMKESLRIPSRYLGNNELV